MIKNFLSNSGYATWSQTIIVILSVLLAYITLVSNDRNINVANALSFVQKYYLESNSLALKSLSLRVNQFDRVQEAKTLIVGYDPNSDASFNILFEKARPLVRSSLESNSLLRSNYVELMQFFDALILCVGSKVCDSDTVVKLMGDELRSFYNAVCPYIDQENMTYKNSETSERFLRFLIHNAGYKNPATDYFCRDKFAQIISEK